LRELIQECSDVNRWQVSEINVMPDHVHILIRLRPDISVSKAVQLLKGRSSKVIRKEFLFLKEFYWGANFWLKGFFVETVGQLSEEAIKKYIKNQ